MKLLLSLTACLCLAACDALLNRHTTDFSGPYVSAQSTGSSLQPFLSERAFSNYLKSGFSAQNTLLNRVDVFRLEEDAITLEMAESSTTTSRTASDGATSANVSGTNLQVSGVDEADLIKSDGESLYVVVNQQSLSSLALQTVAVAAAENVTTSDESLPSENQSLVSGVRFLQLQENGVKEQAFWSAGSDVEVRGLYLPADQSQLVVLLDEQSSMGRYWFDFWSWQQGQSIVELLDIADPENPTRKTRIRWDGHLISSRRIGNKLYLVSRYTPTIAGYARYPMTEVEKQQNRSLLEKAKLDELLPQITINEGSSQPLVSSDRCYLPPMGQGQVAQPNLISIIAIDLTTPDSVPEAVCLSGQTEAIYASTQSLYLATTTNRYETVQTLGTEMVSYQQPEVTTDVHKFAWQDLAYRGSGVVPGHLGWELDKKSFRMGEHQQALHIVTSLGDSWNETSTTRLTVLAENSGELSTRGFIDGLGKPGERLYAARFMGNRGYLVTFRTTDPLYVLDLSDPTKPQVLGELSIPGYSDYLHPVNDQLLLGIGKSAVADSGDADGRGAWYQGLKLALFSLQDPTNPQQVSALDIGLRGTDSAALWDHHAMAWLPADNTLGRPARFTLPVSLHNRDMVWRQDPEAPWRWYDWTHNGLYLFDIDESTESIRAAGKMVVEDHLSAPNGYGVTSGDRALLTDDTVHYVHQSQVWSAPWQSPEQMTGPQ